MYIVLIGYLQQSLYDYNFTAYQIVHYNYLHVDDLLIKFFFHLINSELLLTYLWKDISIIVEHIFQ